MSITTFHKRFVPLFYKFVDASAVPIGQSNYTTERRNNLYKKFERLLAEKNVTAYHVAKELGMATSTFANWKAGRYEPKVDKIKKIADYFGVPLTYFYEED